MLRRRGFIAGLAAALAAPAIIRTPGLLMPVKKVVLEEGFRYTGFYSLVPLGQLGDYGIVLEGWDLGVRNSVEYSKTATEL